MQIKPFKYFTYIAPKQVDTSVAPVSEEILDTQGA